MQRKIKILLFFSILVTILSACDSLRLYETDQAALDSLKEAGSDLTKPHPFDFYLYHNNKAGAQRLCGELNRMDFRVVVQEGALEGEWLCLASLEIVPSIEKLDELSQMFEGLIDSYGGDYDGWETIVISK